MSCHSSGRSMRARRPRPSERTTPSVIPGFPPQGLPSSDGPPPRRGGLRTPAKEGIAASTTLPLLGHRLLGKAPVATQCLAIHPAVPRGRTECVPPRKPPPALSPGFPRKALSPWLAPRGGAGSARPQGGHWLRGGFSQSGSRTLAHASDQNQMPPYSHGLPMRA